MADQKAVDLFTKIKKEIVNIKKFQEMRDFMKKFRIKFPVVLVNYTVEKVGDRKAIRLSVDLPGNADRNSDDVKEILAILKKYKANEIKIQNMPTRSASILISAKVFYE